MHTTRPDAAASSAGEETFSPARAESLLRRRVREIVARLDAAGAGLAADHGGDGAGVLDARSELLGLGAPGRTSAGGHSRLIASADGWIAVSLPRPEDVASLQAWTESDDPAIGSAASPDAAWPALEEVCATRPSRWWVERGALLGLAVFEVGEFARQPAAIATEMGSAPPTVPGGSRVVNLAGLWAGPLAADVCARLGATVTTVESVSRPDGARRTPEFHRRLHGRDAHLALDLRTEEGRRRLAETIAAADVVIEGSRPRALRQMGIDASEMVAHGPRVWVSITGAGRSGPDGERIGFGDDAAAGGGLVGWTADGPVFVADAAADPLTGLIAADETVSRLARGGRWLVDVALARAAGSLFA